MFTEWLGGHRGLYRLFANRSVDTVSSLPSDRRLTLADNTRQKRRTGDNSAQWIRALTVCLYDPLNFGKGSCGKTQGCHSFLSHFTRSGD